MARRGEGGPSRTPQLGERSRRQTERPQSQRGQGMGRRPRARVHPRPTPREHRLHRGVRRAPNARVNRGPPPPLAHTSHQLVQQPSNQPPPPLFLPTPRWSVVRPPRSPQGTGMRVQTEVATLPRHLQGQTIESRGQRAGEAAVASGGRYPLAAACRSGPVPPRTRAAGRRGAARGLLGPQYRPDGKGVLMT